MNANSNKDALNTAWASIAALTRANEPDCVHRLCTALQDAVPDTPKVRERTFELAEKVRTTRSGAGGIEKLMHEYSLSSQEGVALMCLAEALLRIPDTATMDALIRDKLSQGNWRHHLGGSDSLFVNAATWGLMLTGKLSATYSSTGMHNALSRLVSRGGEAIIRSAVKYTMQLLGQQFVLGEKISAAIARSQAQTQRGYTHSFDMLGEAALTMEDADRYTNAYRDAIRAIGEQARQSQQTGHKQQTKEIAVDGISVKLSALFPRYVRAQESRVHAELYPRLLGLAQRAAEYAIGFNIDAEESERLVLSLRLFERLIQEPSLSGWQGLGFVVQAYQKRAPAVIDWLTALARQHARRIMIRLVKGAYWDSEIKRAQVEGQSGYPVFTRKVHTDVSYLVCAKQMLEATDVLYPQFATHNAQTLASIEAMATHRGIVNYEFQCLHGMGEPLYDHVVGLCNAKSRVPQRCRIYAPVGPHTSLLPYLVRRLLENGANSSFVNRIVNESVSLDELASAPLDIAKETGGMTPILST